MDISETVIEEIARQSNSVRSAELSLYTALSNNLTSPHQTHRQILNMIKKRRLDQHITRLNKHWIFNSIRGYDKKTSAVKKRFADFDYRIKVKYEDIEPYFVNNMLEDIEVVTLEEKKFFSKNNFVKKNKSKKKETVVVEDEEIKVGKQQKETTSLSKWGI